MEPIGYPIATVIYAGMVLVAVLMSVGLFRLAPSRESRRAAVAVGGLVIAWLGLSFVLGAAGVYRVNTPVPGVGAAVLIALLVGSALPRLSPAIRSVINAAPLPWLIGLQVYRLEGALFLAVLAQGRLPGTFALPAGWGDFLVGASAPLIAYAYAKGWPAASGLAVLWNLFGIADLIVAVGTGFLASPGPFRLLFTTPSTALLTVLPLVIIPVFLVPLSFLLHLFSLQRLRAGIPQQSLAWERSTQR